MNLRVLGLMLVASLMVGSINAQNKTVEGESFPAKIETDGGTIYLNGGGLREKYTIDLYVGCLYLKKPSMSAKRICLADEAMGIDIKIVSSRVTRDKFNSAVGEGFVKSNYGESTIEQVRKFKSFLHDAFKEGDRIRILYTPDKGVAVYKNGDYRGVIEGLPFKQALFGIWLGSDPADSSLKDDMLGKM